MDDDLAKASVLFDWFIPGQRVGTRIDHIGIPCEPLFDPIAVARVWGCNRP